MKDFFEWFFDKLLSDPLNERICMTICGITVLYFGFQVIMSLIR
jgi:hypothetical protein